VRDDRLSQRILIDRTLKGLLVGVALIVALVLMSIIWFVASRGIGAINWTFLTSLQGSPGASNVGIVNAILGTVMVAGLTTLVVIPFGIWCGIAMAEYPHHPLIRWAMMGIDALQSIPSILFGILAYLWIVVPMGHFSSLSGSVALAFIMLPMVVRSVEESVKQVPLTLREASLALGVSPTRTIMKVVIPCGLNGIVTGALLGLGRIVGETAPLLFTAFGSPFLVASVLEPVQTMPLLIYNYATSPYPDWQQMGWGASFILLVFCFILGLTTRFLVRK